MSIRTLRLARRSALGLFAAAASTSWAVDRGYAGEAPQERAGKWFSGRSATLLRSDQLFSTLTAHPLLIVGDYHAEAWTRLWQRELVAIMRNWRPCVVALEMLPSSANMELAIWSRSELPAAALLDRLAIDDWGKAGAAYGPFLEYCRTMGSVVQGLACSDEFVRRVKKDGWDGIAVSEREGLSPPGEATQAYRHFLFQLLIKDPPFHLELNGAFDTRFDPYVRAQQVRDVAFATNAARLISSYPEHCIIAICGSYHVQFGLGVPAQLTHAHVPFTSVIPIVITKADPAMFVRGMADIVYCIER